MSARARYWRATRVTPGWPLQRFRCWSPKTGCPIPPSEAGPFTTTWQDAAHVRGILRRTSLSDYLTADPHWQTVLDYDALAEQDKQKWVQKGLTCLYPGNELCLVSLSAGGEDADTLREFDLKAGKFVAGGFVLPRSKQSVAWKDKDTLLVARGLGSGEHDENPAIRSS